MTLPRSPPPLPPSQRRQKRAAAARARPARLVPDATPRALCLERASFCVRPPRGRAGQGSLGARGGAGLSGGEGCDYHYYCYCYYYY